MFERHSIEELLDGTAIIVLNFYDLKHVKLFKAKSTQSKVP